MTSIIGLSTDKVILSKDEYFDTLLNFIKSKDGTDLKGFEIKEVYISVKTETVEILIIKGY